MTQEPAPLRLFIAIDLPPQVRDRLASIQKQLRSGRARVRWVPPDNMHLTLVFLGETAPDRVPVLAGILEAVAAGREPFSLALGDVGFFGSPRRPRVLWVGVEDPQEALAPLQAELVRHLRGAGWAPEDRPYHPHLTIGRIRDPRHGAALTEAVGSIKNSPPVGMGVDRLYLFRSTRTARGVQYSVEASSSL